MHLDSSGGSTTRERERVLRLDFECLRSMHGCVNEVRVWHDRILDCDRVGKRLDISGLEHDEVLPEPTTLQAINHRNIVPILSAAEVGGYSRPLHVVELITPYYPMGSVTDALLADRRFVASEAVAALQAVLRGLAELHEVHRIIHRDVKSGNILLSGDSTVAKVADLGLAGRMDGHGSVPIVNNPTLYTPKEFIGVGRLTKASDIYPLSLVLRELLAGPFPYINYTTTWITERLMRGQMPLRHADLKLPIWISADLRRVIAKAGRSDAGARYQSARAMANALARAKYADWFEVSPMRWEIRPGSAQSPATVAVEGRRMQRTPAYRLSTLGRKSSGWRRVAEDRDVASLDSAEARNVFDQACAISRA